jgi:hypothetical protein
MFYIPPHHSRMEQTLKNKERKHYLKEEHNFDLMIPKGISI